MNGVDAPPSVTTDRDHCRDPTDPAPLSSRRCKRRKGWGGVANDVTSRDRPGRGLEPGTCFPEHRLGGGYTENYANFPLVYECRAQWPSPVV